MLEIWGQSISLKDIDAVAHHKRAVRLRPDVGAVMEKSRQLVVDVIARNETVYGINTGFGKLSDMHIDAENVKLLQLNLVRSHAVGVGKPLSPPEVRAMMLLRANVLALGFSGARFAVAQKLVDLLNSEVVPYIPEQGSVGASGDLAPLAHLALALIGEGRAFYKGQLGSGVEALEAAGIEPLVLEAKEGLAILNGTQAMGACGGLALFKAARLISWSTVAGAMTLEALLGTPAAFDERIHLSRPHKGQSAIAEMLRQLLTHSEIRESHRSNDSRVQDAYSLRCMPQVHGAALGAIWHARDVIEIESGSATDNPLVFTDTNEVISGGNFHGAPLALAFDYAAIAMTDMISICERRIDRLVNPDSNEGLPPFLAPHAGMSSGFMMAHVTVAALLNEAKVLAHPASVDSVPTSGGKEDHVSMGMTGALKLRKIVQNAAYATAIELIAAAEGLEYRKPLRPGEGVERAFDFVRSHVPRVDADRSLSMDVEALAQRLLSEEWPGQL